MDGKDIIIQRLRNNKNIKKYKFIESEIKKQVLDFYSTKYENYRKDDTTLIFASTNRRKAIEQITNGEKPNWLSDSGYKNLRRIFNDNKKFLEKLDEYITLYDARTSKYFENFWDMEDERRKIVAEKGENPLYIAEYIISGKLDNGFEFRAPICFREVKYISHDDVKRTIKLILGNKIVPNISFISLLGNQLNIETEKLLKNLPELTTDDEYIQPILDIFKKLNIDIERKYFNNLNTTELRLNRETSISSSDILECKRAAKFIVASLHNSYEPHYASVNLNIEYLNDMLVNNDNEEKYEQILTTILTSFVDNNTLTYHDVVSQQSNNKYFAICVECLKHLSYDIKEQNKIFDNCFKTAQSICLKYEKHIALFSTYLLKHKYINYDQIIEQWNSDSLIPSYDQSEEIKFEVHKFIVEKVRLLYLCPELSELDIFKEVKYIFDNSDFIEKLLHLSINEVPSNSYDESAIKWAFNADMSQQKAVCDTLINDNTIIQGPPGTGKTQTILNIISNALAQQKKVLIVAEKTTALDVINDRIKKLAPSIANFIFDIYNVEKKRIKFYNELGLKTLNVKNNQTPQSYSPLFPSLLKRNNNIRNIAENLSKLDIPSLSELSKDINVTDSEHNICDRIQESNILIDDIVSLDKTKIEEINNFNQTKKKLIDFLNINFSNNNIVEKIKNNLIEVPKIWNEKIVNLLNLLTTKNILCLEKYSFDFVDIYEQWKKEKIELSNFRDRYFKQNISDSIMKQLFELNNSKLYNQSSKHLYGALIETGTAKTNIFNKRKYSKVAEQMKFDQLFGDDFNLFKKYFEFNFNKFSNDENIIICKDLKTIKESGFQIKDTILAYRFLYELNIYLNDNIKNENGIWDWNKICQIDLTNFNLIKDFNFNKFNEYQIKTKEIYEMCIREGCNFERIKQILKFLNDKKQALSLISMVDTTSLWKFDDINNKMLLNQCQMFIFKIWHDYLYRVCTKDPLMKYRRDQIISCIEKKKVTSVVKQIVSDNWKFIYESFPIVLATPETLPRFIPLQKGLYDIVIIDEASQFLVEKSIPAIFRGKKHVISGDNQQLRPKIENRFNIDKINVNEHIENYQLVEAESILDLFEGLVGESGTKLTTHYRSEKNELIDFSNKEFYNDELNFIETSDSIRKGIAIQVIDVPGKWSKKCENQIEANRIIEELNNIYTSNKNASVGVVVFSKQQARLIKRTLFRLANEYVKQSFDSDLPDTLFVKSIDEVQGEERDIIIFGITYGKEVKHYMLLSEEFARNKINVAVTRAKQRIIIIKSHKSNEYWVPRSETSSDGPKILFKYLKYAEEINNQTGNSRHEEDMPLEERMFIKYLFDNKISIFKDVVIKGKRFYVADESDNMSIYFLVTPKMLLDIRNNVWFYEALFKSRGYKVNPVLFNKIYKI